MLHIVILWGDQTSLLGQIMRVWGMHGVEGRCHHDLVVITQSNGLLKRIQYRFIHILCLDGWCVFKWLNFVSKRINRSSFMRYRSVIKMRILWHYTISKELDIELYLGASCLIVWWRHQNLWFIHTKRMLLSYFMRLHLWCFRFRLIDYSWFLDIVDPLKYGRIIKPWRLPSDISQYIDDRGFHILYGRKWATRWLRIVGKECWFLDWVRRSRDIQTSTTWDNHASFIWIPWW